MNNHVILVECGLILNFKTLNYRVSIDDDDSGAYNEGEVFFNSMGYVIEGHRKLGGFCQCSSCGFSYDVDKRKRFFEIVRKPGRRKVPVSI